MEHAAWGRFLLDELELGTKEASALWLRSFWKAMDRLLAGGVLRNCPEDYHGGGERLRAGPARGAGRPRAGEAA